MGWRQTSVDTENSLSKKSSIVYQKITRFALIWNWNLSTFTKQKKFHSGDQKIRANEWKQGLFAENADVVGRSLSSQWVCKHHHNSSRSSETLLCFGALASLEFSSTTKRWKCKRGLQIKKNPLHDPVRVADFSNFKRRLLVHTKCFSRHKNQRCCNAEVLDLE